MDDDELEEPPVAPTSQNNTKKVSAPRAAYKEVRTAIEAKKLQHVTNQAQALVVDKDQDVVMAPGTTTGTGYQATKSTSYKGPNNRPSTKRAHVYGITVSSSHTLVHVRKIALTKHPSQDPDTPTIRSPVAKRMRGSRIESSSKASKRPLPQINWGNQAEPTKRAKSAAQNSAVSSLVDVRMDIFGSPLNDTPEDLFRVDGAKDPKLQVEESGGGLEGTYDAADDRCDIRIKQRVKRFDQPTRVDTDSKMDEATSAVVESNDNSEYLSSEASSSEYEPSEKSKPESMNDVDEVDSDAGLGLAKMSDDEPVIITPSQKYRAPFLNETFDDYKEWHEVSGEEDDFVRSMLIQRGYYGDSLDEPDGSQPVDELEPFEHDEAYDFSGLNPCRDVSGYSRTRL